ncbi:hypothetical protein [Alkalihalobacillus sp. R86527]|uniref:hypothetical protein n=1 Tax=Alkalihalobacillus sp. R86527 TaxID=3093863 RepID=UPI00366E4898
MKEEILNKAKAVDEFNHMEELLAALEGNSHSKIVSDHEIHYGFKVILDVIANDNTVQRDTLLATALFIKRNYGVMTGFKYRLKKLNAISLTVNHVMYRLKHQQIKAIENAVK